MLKTWLLLLTALPLSAALPPKLPPQTKIEQRIARDIQWFRTNLPAAYEKAGVKNAKWDADVMDALTAVAQLWSNDPNRPGNEHERAWQASERAMKAGCHDALVQYVHARMYALAAQETEDESARLMKAAAAAMDRSSYASIFKFYAHARAAEALVGDTNLQIGYVPTSPDTLTELDAAKAAWPKVVASLDTPPELVLDAFQTYSEARHNAKGDRKADGNALIAAYEKSTKKGLIVPLLRARLLIDTGWDARGSKTADKTSSKAVETFESNLHAAEGEVKKAIDIDPASPAIAPLMLAIQLGICCENQSEAWFRYGIAVDPGDLGLWFDRLHGLEPRWNGSAEEMLAFGHEALATKKWAQRTPFVLIFAHFTLANYDDDYYKDAAACRDVHAVFEPYLKMYPDANYERSGYASLLYKCGEYPAAQRELDRLGTNVRNGPFIERANIKNMYGMNALMMAAFYGKTEMVKLLIEAKWNVNASDSAGTPVLYDGVKSGNIEVVKLLLNGGAKASAKKKQIVLDAAKESKNEELQALVAQSLTSAK